MTDDRDIETGELAENAGDEADIINDQDETAPGGVNAADRRMGGVGVKNYGLDGGPFARGEVDLVDQMSRVTKQMDHATHRTGDDPFAGIEKDEPAGDAR